MELKVWQKNSTKLAEQLLFPILLISKKEINCYVRICCSCCPKVFPVIIKINLIYICFYCNTVICWQLWDGLVMTLFYLKKAISVWVEAEIVEINRWLNNSLIAAVDDTFPVTCSHGDQSHRSKSFWNKVSSRVLLDIPRW